MRLFVAIDIPAEIKDALRCFVDRLRPTAQIGWSPIDNLHITTKFIGEWPEPRLGDMKHTLTSLPTKGAIDITIKGLGWFPNARRPRVFWAGVEGREPLHALAHATAQAVAELGVPIEERAYSPHLTLARVRETIPLDRLHQTLDSFPAGCGFNFGSFRATQFFLYLSAGGKYTQLAGFPLDH
jgi:RNA 2',3'-cyclic 3'-phosphodiesterase